MLSVAAGHHWQYLTSQVASGKENYYTGAVERGEPPGVWQGAGAADLGLEGEVTERQMDAVYGHFVDPRDPGFADRAAWADAAKLGQPPRKFRSRDEILLALLEAEPNATPERVEELAASAARQTRAAVAFIDVTYSVPKSVSVLHTALRAQEAAADRAGDATGAARWRDRAEKVEAAIWAGNNAALDYLQREAGFSRTGYHGPRQVGRDSVGRYVDAHRWVVASFFQHTSRPTAAYGEQPNLHIHNAVLNRVECPDGKWRTLDSRAIHKVRGAAGALAERVTAEQLVQTLGVESRMRADGRAREVAGVPERVRDWFSARRRAITERTAAYAELWRQRMGRDPNALELTRLAAAATLDTRDRKLKVAPDAQDRVARWAEEVRREVDTTMADIAHDSLGRVPDAAAASQPFRPAEVIAKAVADVQATKSAWTRYDLVRALDRYLPDCLGGAPVEQLERVREELADRALRPDASAGGDRDEVWRLTAPELVAAPAELRRADGSSMYRPHGSDRYATRGQLELEERLEAAARTPGGAPMLPAEHARAVLAGVDASLAADGEKLGGDQAAALYGILTSGRPVETLIGPAGTGKSYVLGTLADVWEQQVGGRVFGLALAQRAAEVLREEGISRTDNVANWRVVQQRIDRGRAAPEDQLWRLRAGDLVVVDEAGLADTAALAEVQRRAEAAGAKLLFAGDPAQLKAVGAGGAMSIVAAAGPTYELSEVRRFRQRWERDASLRLRAGDAAVLAVYERHGRLVEGGTAAQAGELAARAWLADTLRGRSAVMVVDTNEQAAELSAQAQAQLVALGRVSEPAAMLADANRAGFGDLVAARQNDRRIRTAAGAWVVNRYTYRVAETAPDGSLVVRRVLGQGRRGERLGAPLTMPAGYVQQHVTLAYASTVHGVQGATVGTCHSVVTSRTAADALYVMLSRGWERNTAYVATVPDPHWRTPEDAVSRAAGATVQPRAGARRDEPEPATPLEVLARVLERADPDRAAVEVLREELAEATSLRTLGAIWTDVQQQTATPRYEQLAQGMLPEQHADRLAADPAAGPLWRLVRAGELAGNDAEQLLRDAVNERELTTAASVAEVLHWRVQTRLGEAVVPRQDTYVGRTGAGSDVLSRFAVEVAEAMDERAGELGEQAVQEPPRWLVEHLGPVPDDPVDRVEWTTRAGRVLAYREQYDYDEQADAIGACPAPANPEARAGWYAAWRALGEPDTTPDEATQTDVQLRAAVAAYGREEAWAPAWVGPQLRAAEEAAQGWREWAYLTAAQARQEPDPDRRRRLHADAAGYARLAREGIVERNQLGHVDDVRAQWYVHTAPAREAAARARDELRRRDQAQTQAPAEAAVTAEQLSRDTVLRQLVDDGVLTDAQARQLRADPAAAAMWRAVERAEQAGRDPAEVLEGAVRGRELDTAESPAAVLHWRIERTLPDTTAADQAVEAPESTADRDAQLVDDRQTGPPSAAGVQLDAEDVRDREDVEDDLEDERETAQREPEPVAAAPAPDAGIQDEAAAEREDEREQERERQRDVSDREAGDRETELAAHAGRADSDRVDAAVEKAAGPATADRITALRERIETISGQTRELAEEVRRADQAREIMEQRQAAEQQAHQRQQAEHEEQQRRTYEAEHAAEQTADRQGPSLSL